MKIGPAVPEICSRTDRHTDRQTSWSQYSAPLPGRSTDHYLNTSRRVTVPRAEHCFVGRRYHGSDIHT